MNVNVSQFQHRLMKWFKTHKRDLPWRRQADPYRIFVVEVMLQQTQIKTVIPYYERWLKAFPNIQALAKAPLDRVLKLWEGLGYYSRARNLHQAAQMIVRRFGGKVPSDPVLLESLPGIGRYTAGAIASIAFGKPVPLVDGNVARVFSRIFYIRKDVADPKTQKMFYAIAEKLVPKKEPGIFNQALMELGSLVCIPEIPKCTICPVKRHCLAFRKGNPSRLPVKQNRLQIKKIDMAVGILKQENCLLVRRRPPSGIWGGLWEIPSAVCAQGESLEKTLTEEFKEALGISIKILGKAQPFEHHFTHRKATIYPFYCQMNTRPDGKLRRKARGICWVSLTRPQNLSFPVPHQKILSMISNLKKSS